MLIGKNVTLNDASTLETHLQLARDFMKDNVTRYKEELPLRKRMFESNYAELVPWNEGTSEWHKKHRPRFAPSVLPTLIKELSYLYSAPPRRSLPEEELSTYFNRALWRYGNSLNSVMLTADRYCRRDGMCLLVPVHVDEDHDTMMEEGFLVQVVSAARFVPIMGLHPNIPEAVIYTTRDIKNDSLVKSRTWHYLSANLIATLEEQYASGTGTDNLGGIDFVVTSAAPGVGITQAVVCREDPAALQGEDVWGVGLGGTDLLKSILAYGKSWSELSHNSSIQRGQPVATADIKEGIIMSPETPIVVPNGDFRFEANKANIEGMIATSQLQHRTIASSSGVDPTAIDVRTTVPESGKAIQIREHMRTKDRVARTALFQSIEASLHVICSVVAVKLGLINRRLLAHEYSIAYTYPEPPLSVEELILRQQHEFANGMLTVKSAKTQLYSNLSPEEIDRELEAARLEKGEKEVSQNDDSIRTTSINFGIKPGGDASGESGGDESAS